MEFGPLTEVEADKAVNDLQKQSERVLNAVTRIDRYRAIVDLEILAGDAKRFLAAGGNWTDANESAVTYDKD